ncbi:MAG: ABC transporter ATP-binding protein [Acidobacteria bacterium]|nr:ABC transporter ATP-binding protein [Acidobacteriota bacterium]
MPGTGPSEAPLVCRGVAKRYRQHFWQRPSTSLHGLDLEVRRGEILGLLGPNGAGKTTTIKLALGLIFPERGEVRLNGRPASDPAARRGVGYLPENPYFPDDLTGRELVEFAGRLHGMPSAAARRRAGELLALTGIASVADRKLRRYSKGMVQRAGMARALVAEPDFVILDEPMSGLDPVGRREFRDLILDLRRRGATILFSSHVLSDAEMLCDRVAILDAGRLLALRELGTLESGRAVLRWEVEVSGGGEIAGAEVLTTRGAQRLLRFPASMGAQDILAAVRAAGAEPRSLVPQRETLEDLFLRTLADGDTGR